MKNSIASRISESLILADNKMLRYSLFVALYFAQGIFEGFALFALPVWMAANGKSATEIASFVAILLLPWSFKFFLGPLVDKFTFLSMGRKRPWIIVSQIGVFLCFIGLSFLSNPLDNMAKLMVICFILSLFTAFQDISTDGLAIEITPKEENGRVNALMWGSKVVAVSLWLAASTWLINTFGFQRAVFFPAVAVLAVVILVILVREHSGEKRMPWSAGKASTASKAIQPESWKVLFKTILKMMTIRTSLLFMVFILLLQIIFNLINTLNKVFIVQQLNWEEAEVSNWIATCILVSGLLGLFFAGFLIKRLGKLNIIIWGFWFIAFVCAAMYACHPYWQYDGIIEIFTMAFYSVTTIMVIAMFAIAMTLCHKSIAASQFTVFMAMGNLGYMAGAKLLGILKEHVDWSMIFVATVFLSLLALLVFKGFEKALTRKAALDSLNDPAAVSIQTEV